jgi:hypothetical protein
MIIAKLFHNYLPVRIQVRIDPAYPIASYGAVLRIRPKKRGPMSQQVWHDNNPSLLKGPHEDPG